MISEKDEDIDKQSALILRLREQVLQLEESNRTYRNDNDLISRELTECQQENESLKELNVHLSEGIEQLARKYDEKCKEIDRKQKEAERLARQLHNKMEALILAKDELEKVKELNTTMKQSVAHVIKNLSIGCGFVDSYVRQILPSKITHSVRYFPPNFSFITEKESSIREKVAESIDIGKEKVYEDFAQPMEHADEPFDEELEVKATLNSNFMLKNLSLRPCIMKKKSFPSPFSLSLKVP